jgi:hypothetical protein
MKKMSNKALQRSQPLSLAIKLIVREIRNGQNSKNPS